MHRPVNSLPIISFHAAAIPADVALCGTLDIVGGDGAPEWLHLLPAGSQIFTQDGRGPYKVGDHDQLMGESLKAGDRLVLDENHSTDLAAPMGLPAPAMGWIVELESRADGIYGKVEWTPDGEALVKARKYRAISPVIRHEKATGRVTAILRASLVNAPNLKGLHTLHQEQNMDLLKELAKKLGLADGVSAETVVAAVETLQSSTTALQSQVGAIAKAAGVKEDANQDTILGAISNLGKTGDAAAITALQASLTEVTTELNTMKTNGAKKAAETFVDGAIAAGRVGVKALRDHYVTRHQANSGDVEKEINGLPILNGSSVVPLTPPGKDANGKRILTADQEGVIERMSLNRDDFIKSLDAQEAAEARL